MSDKKPMTEQERLAWEKLQADLAFYGIEDPGEFPDAKTTVLLPVDGEATAGYLITGVAIEPAEPK